MARYTGNHCPVCEQAFTDDDDIVVCPDCGTPYHRACWPKEGCVHAAEHGQFEWRPDNAPEAEEPVCPNCGAHNPPGAHFCNHCGVPLPDHPENADRWVRAYWATDVKENYKASLELTCMDRANLVSDIALALGDMRVPIYSLMARAAEQGRARMSVTVGITNTEHLNSVVSRLQKVKDVISVTRS